MLKQSRFVLLTSLLLVTLGGVTSARTHVSVMAGVVRLPAVPGANFETDRDRDGLSGPVRRIKTETARLVPKDGQMIEAARQTLETATYDIKGAKVDYAFFPTATDSLTGKEVYKYDDKGNIAEMTLLAADGSVLSKETYQYEFDKLGNWIKMTTLVAVVENGQLVFEPKEITYRSITYYLEDSVAKAMQGGLNAQTPAGTTTVANAATPAPPAAAKPSLTTVKMEVASNSAPSSVTAANNNAAASTATKQTANPLSTNNNPAATTSGAVVKKQPAAAAAVSATDAPPLTTSLTTSANLTLKSPEPIAAVTSPSAAVVKTEEGTAPPSQPLRGTPVKPISGGVLNGKAVELPKPDYPEMARRARTSGMVTVEVVIDVTGKVISAKAISGPSMLQRAAEMAARRARFTPTLLSGQPVKMTGTINYNFAM